MTEISPGAMFLGTGTPQPGVNVDRIDRPAGLAMLASLGYDDPRTAQVIDYALWRWGKGEEAAAQKGAIDASFYGIDLTSWYMVLAAAQAEAERKAAAS